MSADLSALPTTTFGRTGVSTSRLGLGCSRFGSVLADRPRAHWITLAREALDLGIRHFDTADIYGQGDSERLLGEALRGHRTEIAIASKGGQIFSAQQSVAALLKRPLGILARHLPSLKQAVAARRAKALATDFTPDYLARALENSLRRLQTDYLDIYYLHSPPVPVIESDEVFAVLARWRESGKIRSFGISCDSIEQAAAAVVRPGVDLVQFAVDDGPFARAVLETASARGVAIVARGGPVPAGATSDDRRHRLAALALRPEVSAVLIGTTQLGHLRENVDAVSASLR